MKIREDFRMKVVSEESAIQYLNTLQESWIYIKHLNNNSYNGRTKQIVTYTKFKVKNVNIDSGTIFIYGAEDDDRLIIDQESIISYQMTQTRDELFIQIDSCYNRTDVFIKKYLPNAKQRLNEILESNHNLIITEGKTDWKHLKSALLYFQNKGEYVDINFSFFEYEDEIQMGEDTLLKVLEYNRLFYSSGIKIFIFDADVIEINEKHGGKEFKDWGNNVYSFILPVPDFRENTPLISIENYYTDNEIKTVDKEGRRLYINSEFDSLTGVLNGTKNIFDIQHGKHRKLPSNYIIDEKIFLVPDEIGISNDNIYQITKRCPNIALSKNGFAEYISKQIPPFDKICFDNFKLIFDIIRKIQNQPNLGNVFKQESYVDEVEISKGVYIKTFSNGLQTLEICIEENEHTLQFGKEEFFSVAANLDKEYFNIIIYQNFKEILNIPLTLNRELLEFLHDKVDNQYNRIELHFFNGKGERIIEVFSGDTAGALINRELLKLYS